MKLVIVVPCYNEEEVLAETTRQLSSVVDELLSDGKIDEGKILYVDDGSRDRTWELIRGFSETHPSVTGLKLAHNVGHQQALWAGLEWAASHADAAVSIDADLQDDVRSIVGMVDAWRGGADIVYGVRRERTTDTFFKKNTAQAFYKLMNALGGDIVYNHADFRLMSRRTLQALMAYPERNLFLRGMVSALGYPSARVYYDRKERMAGESKYPLKKMLSFAFDGITSFSIKPITLISAVGILIIVVSIIAAIYSLISYFCGNATPGWTSLILSIWFLGGVQLVSIGLIGQYIGKIYVESKHRPRYNPEIFLSDETRAEETK